MPEQTTKTAPFLNWISYCLVTNPRHQSVAASLAFDQRHRSAVIYLATNSLSLDTAKYSDALCDAVNAALLAQLEYQNDGLEGCTPDGLRQILTAVAGGAYRRMVRKLQLVQEAALIEPERQPPRYPGGVPRATLFRILSEWYNPAAATPILEAYDKLSVLPPALLHPDTWLETWSEIMKYSAIILSSEFTTPIQSQELRSKVNLYDLGFMYRLYRRVWRLTYYQSGAYSFFTHIPKSWRNLLSEGWRVRFSWIPHTPPMLLSIPDNPLDTIMSLLRRRGHDPTYEQILSFYPDRLVNCWRQGQTFECRMHPEIQLIGFLLDSNLSVSMNVVGASKRPCRACRQCGEGIVLNGVSQTYEMMAQSGRSFTDWMVPSWAESIGIKGTMERLVTSKENAIARMYESRLKQETSPRPELEGNLY